MVKIQMRPIHLCAFLVAVLLGVQAQQNDQGPKEGNAGNESKGAENFANPMSYSGEKKFENGEKASASGREDLAETSARPDQTTTLRIPEAPGIHLGFQAIGPNSATTISGGLKSSEGALEMGANFAGRYGDPVKSIGVTQNPNLGSGSRTDQRQPAGSNQQQSSTQQPSERTGNRNIQGATFAVSYKPGLLTTVGNMLNPFRMFQQLGDAVMSLTGFGQGQRNAIPQSQVSSPQTSGSDNNNNGVGITWKPLYRFLW